MKRIIDQIILLLFCFTSLLFFSVSTEFIVAFLAAVIYTTLNYYMDSEKKCFAMTLVYFVLTVWNQQLVVFAPLILYNIFRYKIYPMMAVLGVGVLYLGKDAEAGFLWLLGIGCVMAALLQYQNRKYEELLEKLRKTRDDGEELNMVLKEKNQTLLQNQDYEIYTATLKERNRIAREIHDNVGHMLSRSILMVGAMKAVHGQGTLTKPLEQLEETLNTAMTNVRESVHDIHDESVNLKEVLESLVEEFHFCAIEMKYDMGYTVPKEVKYSFIAIVKEALNNVIRHSDAKHVEIKVREHPGIYQLVIEDDGTVKAYQNLYSLMETGKGMGLGNMKERVGALQGTMQIQRKQGFRIFITVPKKEGENI